MNNIKSQSCDSCVPKVTRKVDNIKFSMLVALQSFDWILRPMHVERNGRRPDFGAWLTFLCASIEYFLPAKTSWSQVVPPGGPVDANTVSGQSSSVGATPTPPTVLPPHPSTTPTPIQPHQQPASEHRFTYSDISVTSLRGLEPHISVSVPQVGDVRVVIKEQLLFLEWSRLQDFQVCCFVSC